MSERSERTMENSANVPHDGGMSERGGMGGHGERSEESA
jgi:hypothetical protein